MFTEQERPYLSRQKKKPDWVVFWLVLGFLFVMAFILDVGFRLTEVHAQAPEPTIETIMQSDKEAYEEGENYTLSMCEKFIESRIN